MLNLSIEHEKLKEKYRSIFKKTILEIEHELYNLQDEEKIKYLNQRLNNLIRNTKSKILAKRATYQCNRCGTCCKFAISEFSPTELQNKAQNGDKIAKEFISTFIPYRNKEDYKNIYPQYLELLKGKNYFVYHCPKVTKDNRCPDYKNRPKICKDFPDNPIAFLPKHCGFSDWKTESEDLWLKLNAESEIINFLVSEFN